LVKIPSFGSLAPFLPCIHILEVLATFKLKGHSMLAFSVRMLMPVKIGKLLAGDVDVVMSPVSYKSKMRVLHAG